MRRVRLPTSSSALIWRAFAGALRGGLEQVEGLAHALTGLNQREREIVIERAVLDLRPEQVAERHGMSRGALEAAYSRALAKLRREAGGVDGDG